MLTLQPKRVTTELKQWCIVPYDVNLVREKVIREMNVIEGVTLVQITIGHSTYSDDTALLGEDIDMINHLLRKLINIANGP